MSLILYNDDSHSVVGITLPPHTSSSLVDDFEYNGSLEFNTQDKMTWLKIQNWLKMRNSNLTFNKGTNIRGKTTGDYTCWCQDTVTLRYFKAIIRMKRSYSASGTAFHKNGVWEKDGSTFSLDIQEVV